MQVSVEASAGLERRMRVQVPAERIEKEVAVRLASVGKSAKIQGFRPGKVPAKVIQQRFGGQVRQEVLQEMVQSSYSEAVAQENLKPAGSPNIEPENLDAGNDLAYTAVFEVYPEFEVTGLDKIKLQQPEVEIADADVELMVENLRKQRATWKPVDRKAADGDQVTLDFEGTLKGEPFEGGSASDFEVILGEGAMLDDFEKGLKNVKAGETKSFKVKFPKDYHAADLAGAKAEFACTIKAVAERELPPVDEEFVKAYGVESGSVDDFHADIRGNMQREVEAKTRAECKRQILEGLLEQNPIDVPHVLVHQECHAMQQETMQRMGIQDVAQAPDAHSFHDAAGKRVRLGLLMGAVIRENEIELERDRVVAKVDELVAPYDNPDEIRNIYLQNPQMLNQVENVVLEEQVIEWLQTQAKRTQKSMRFQELMEL